MATDKVEIITHKVTQLGSNKIGGLILGGNGAAIVRCSLATEKSPLPSSSLDLALALVMLRC